MTYRDLTRKFTKQMEELGIENHQQESNWILNYFTRMSFAERMAAADKEAPLNIATQIEEAIQKRAGGVPLAYIFGEWEFFGYDFYVDNSTLIPRPETETLVDWALKYIETNFQAKSIIRLLDIGAGTGCIGLTMALKDPRIQLVAIEKSSEATQLFKKNKGRHKLQARAELINLDFSESENLKLGIFDMIVANPPYIAELDPEVEPSVLKFEPRSALFSGNAGLEHIQKWSEIAVHRLAEGGAMGFEIGKDQGFAALEIFQRLGHFSKTYLVQDLALRDRVVCGEKK